MLQADSLPSEPPGKPHLSTTDPFTGAGNLYSEPSLSLFNYKTGLVGSNDFTRLMGGLNEITHMKRFCNYKEFYKQEYSYHLRC